ncbi:MAG: asparagine synthase (glutamine-hydrolyzing) [Fibrobacter sp.]|nr:asparagine synthase (glutamine-hydrolyzing) [Fibrobacter sp.]
MCGIAGVYNSNGLSELDKISIHPMTEILAHRGPDDQGFYSDECISLGQRRLSIIDLSGGKQPMCNEDRTIWIIFNGEIFNYIELMNMLKKKGHRFSTRSDTEVLVHLYEEYNTDFFQYCNGQFSIALWDTAKKRLLLARDRVGIRPLFYSILKNGTILFASEMKSLFCHRDLKPQIDPAGFDQIFSIWTNIPPTTVFKNVNELPPGSFLITESSDSIRVKRYWGLQFPDRNSYVYKPVSFYEDRLRELLYDSVTIRLRADVPVASYLSGGIDSSIISTLVKKNHCNDLITFSVAFKDDQFDERDYQQEMVQYLKTDHHTIDIAATDIGEIFSEVIWYTEKPLIRTAPAPLFLLSKLVRDNGIKVVLTGEGADELFGGYDIFKENAIRRFWARQPFSIIRPELFSRIYPDVKGSKQTGSFWKHFFSKDLLNLDNPFYSHSIRWNNTGQIKSVFSQQYREQFDIQSNVYEQLQTYLNADFARWHPLSSAQYLETMLFLPGYLLSSQGDRMMMGNSVEGRFPFLDYRIIEFASTIPPEYKLLGLQEKYILKRAYRDILPQRILMRTKKPYRSPISQCFSGSHYINEVLSENTLVKDGFFNVNTVQQLVQKMRNKTSMMSERENMALVAVISTQMLNNQFTNRKWND